ncbi:thyrostimulin beta-5 subunit isoform X3 [Dermacentor andersoni]|uniref:thyrostimulin beta-5 subunit isoform X3 n=2 Tax=Dermacentor andersoni TaxID=34620 RepID=UPI0024177DF7|nr:thyrostimulin beta-5 subunit-like isoform X3 [Dermacentor andersoni]
MDEPSSNSENLVMAWDIPLVSSSVDCGADVTRATMRKVRGSLPVPAVVLLVCWLLVAGAASASSTKRRDDADELLSSAVRVAGGDAVDTLTTLDCHRREYSFRAARTDANGNRCWDDVTAMSCWGRCDSGEIADWRFPFKKSFHPVCTYGSRKLVRAQLRFCDPEDLDERDELRSYEYYEALSCSCQVCDSTWTSCEGFRHP